MGDEVVFTQPQVPTSPHENPSALVRIRVAEPSDANPLIELLNGLMRDGQRYLSEALPYTLEQQTEYLQQSGQGHVILLSEDDTGLTGWISLQRGRAKYSMHVGTIIMGVRKDKQHAGIGAQLLKQVESLALLMHIERLELAVRVSNLDGYRFYMKNGFFVEGRKFRSVRNGPMYDDEILMAKLIRT